MTEWMVGLFSLGIAACIVGTALTPAPDRRTSTGYRDDRQPSRSATALFATGLIFTIVSAAVLVDGGDFSVPTEVIVALVAALAVGGLGFGFTERLVVFRNYTDMVLVFAIPVAASVLLVISIVLTEWAGAEFPVHIWWLIPALLVVIAARTLADNRNPLFALMALVVKFPLSLLTMYFILDLIVPTGTYRARARRRRRGFIGTLLIAPLVLRLVQQKGGVLGQRFGRRLGFE